MSNPVKFDFSSNQTKIILHVVVWLMFFSIPLYNIIFSSFTYNNGFIIIVGICVATFYLNFSYLVPKYMIRKKWTIYFALLLVVCAVNLYFFSQQEPPEPKMRIPDQFRNKMMQSMHRDDAFKLFPGILFFILMISVSSFLKIFESWDENFKRKKEIENENRISELNFLKAQLNPHFFFNSLNTIYSLSISKSPKTSRAILNLSELMRYMLYEKKENGIEKKVKLTDELEYINNYIELQKLRITPNNIVEISIIGDTGQVEIYPLLFISFIENAFKFGMHPVKKNAIRIVFKIQENILEFQVTNHIHFQNKSYDSFGLGNENSKRRLNLYYPGSKLEIETGDNLYNVTLKLDLDEN